MVERTIRLGVLRGILQRAEILEENEKLVGLEFDEQVNLITLIIEEENR